MRRIKREQGHTMSPRQLAKNVVAANSASQVRRDKAASFHPEDFHGDLGITGRRLRERALVADVRFVCDGRSGAVR